MAFNFNWSPLTADKSFYTRAQELLTAALNKSPKPPIIVDDIFVDELNLGSVPPDLEILEIGDLAEDRFRGIFKMCYTGNAFVTLKTRVQANPLNTYLSTRPSFASPEPLAAAAGLTIPLKISLSNIKLSAFIILVFSKQKGLTLVFRSDPLESLKVSSTFDSIPFVRDYLQKEIEGQLRTLLMDEVPAIIHRLSLRLWVPEYRSKDDENTERAAAMASSSEEMVADPFSSPPQDPVDSDGNVLDAAQIASLVADSSTETHSLFSQKNLLRLAALNDSQRTLSLFTPSMRDVVFRAWAGPMERGEHTGVHSLAAPALSRKHSEMATRGTTYSFSTGSDAAAQSIRPSLLHRGSSFVNTGLQPGKHGKPGRKRKNRIVDLRKPKASADDVGSVSGESTTSTTNSLAASDPSYMHHLPPSREDDEPVTPPGSPPHTRTSPGRSDVDKPPQRQEDSMPPPPPFIEICNPPQLRREDPVLYHGRQVPQPGRSLPQRPKPSRYFQSFQFPPEKPSTGSSAACSNRPPPTTLAAPFPYLESSPGGILEQAWMMKMAGEIARRVQDQKIVGEDFWSVTERDEAPPPAYLS